MGIIERLNYITVYYTSNVESVKLMVQEHYNKKEFDNYIIFINVIPDLEDPKLYLSYNKRIYYMMEHKVHDDDYYGKQYEKWDSWYLHIMKEFNIDEIWTMDYNPQFAISYNYYFGLPIKYMPVRYTTLIKPVENIYTTQKTVDYCHVGIITGDAQNRYDFIKEVEKKHPFSIKCITQVKSLRSVTPELNLSKYVIDILRDKKIITQNQVRIFELLCMGYTVCSEKCEINIFPGLIYEWNTIEDLQEIVENDEYLHPTEKYKEMTYTDEAYEKYVNNLIEQWNTLG